jgi:hypothetical protein
MSTSGPPERREPVGKGEQAGPGGEFDNDQGEAASDQLEDQPNRGGVKNQHALQRYSRVPGSNFTSGFSRLHFSHSVFGLASMDITCS